MKRLILVFSMLPPIVSAGAEVAGASAEEVVQRLGRGNPQAGKTKSDAELCQGCHGETGVNTLSSYPKLTGQYSDYILKQLRNFKSGERKHPIMNGMAENISEADMSDIASYFASNETMQGDHTGETALAKNLFTKGDLKRDVLPCASCHGTAGKGAFSSGDIYPVIGGQHKLYLREQLLNWRSGTRSNGPGGVMNFITRSLSDGEIDALSNYISGL